MRLSWQPAIDRPVGQQRGRRGDVAAGGEAPAQRAVGVDGVDGVAPGVDDRRWGPMVGPASTSQRLASGPTPTFWGQEPTRKRHSRAPRRRGPGRTGGHRRSRCRRCRCRNRAGELKIRSPVEKRHSAFPSRDDHVQLAVVAAHQDGPVGADGGRRGDGAARLVGPQDLGLPGRDADGRAARGGRARSGTWRRPVGVRGTVRAWTAGTRRPGVAPSGWVPRRRGAGAARVRAGPGHTQCPGLADAVELAVLVRQACRPASDEQGTAGTTRRTAPARDEGQEGATPPATTAGRDSSKRRRG